MEKDFTFYPSTYSSLNCLTADQVETYNQDGYLKSIPLFDNRHGTQVPDGRGYLYGKFTESD